MSQRQSRPHRLIRALGAAALLVVTACSGDGPTSPVPADEVRVSNNRFTPANRTVTIGMPLTFRWASGSATHNVTFNDGPASPNQSSGTFQRTFNTVGAFPYQCTLHAGMTGTITVQPVMAMASR
jgi:plastocyanin